MVMGFNDAQPNIERVVKTETEKKFQQKHMQLATAFANNQFDQITTLAAEIVELARQREQEVNKE
jgi:hypothetical protein